MAKKIATKSDDDSNKNKMLDALEKPLNFFIAVIGLIGIGVTIGTYFNSSFKDSEMQVKLIQAQNDCSEKVQLEKEKCIEYKMSQMEQKVTDLENVKNSKK